MTSSSHIQLSDQAAAALVPRGGVILAETRSDDPTGTSTLRVAAIRVAAGAGARLVLYDAAAESLFCDPYPSGPWTVDVDGPNGERPLTAEDLAMLGREALRRQVISATAAGVQATAWLPRGVGAPALGDAEQRTGARLIIRAALRRGSLLDRLLSRSEAAYRRTLRAPTATVDPEGNLLLALGSSRPSGVAQLATPS